MAKAKKKEPIEEIKVEEAVVESVAEETTEAVDDSTEKFITAQLKSINKMSDRAKAKRLAKRVLRNRKG
jgi:hypothetical protein